MISLLMKPKNNAVIAIALFVLFTNISVKSAAQIRFEKGYYKDNAGKRTECFIRNIDWQYNPAAFTYKLTEEAAPATATLEQVKEFGVLNGIRYIRFEADIDTSAYRVIDGLRVSEQQTPQFKRQTVFLKLLVEGPAQLFSYRKSDANFFFYCTDGEHAVLLAYRKYLEKENLIAENNAYQGQLDYLLARNNRAPAETGRIKYWQSDLVRFFERLNNITPASAGRKQRTTLKIKAGIQYEKFRLYSSNLQGVAFPGKFDPTFGLEAEFILPYNKNKWGILIGADYSSFKQTKPSGEDIKYTTINLSVGGRHYFFLRENSKLFLNAQFGFAIPLNSYINAAYNRFDFASSFNTSFGAGWKYNRFSAEIRYIPGSNRINYTTVGSRYSAAGLVLGYDLF